MPTYSLSSAPRPARSTAARVKKVSTQLGRLTAGSRATSEHCARSRGVSEDRSDSSTACSNNNRMSKAAAWMWYTRGIGDAAHASDTGAEVVPTHRQLLMVNVSTRKKAAGTQPSRFKLEATAARRLAAGASHQAASTPLSGAALIHDGQLNEEQRPSTRVVNHLYDESELSRLHELLDQTDIDKLHFKLSARLIAPCRPSAAIFTPLKTSPTGCQIKPLSAAFHKLFKLVYTKVHNTSSRNSVMDSTGRPSYAGLYSTDDPHKLGGSYVQHVIHHHHHHFHHIRRSSLDSPHSPYDLVPHLQEFVKKRRHSYQNCSQAQGLNHNNMVEADQLDDDSLCTEGSVCVSSC